MLCFHRNIFLSTFLLILIAAFPIFSVTKEDTVAAVVKLQTILDSLKKTLHLLSNELDGLKKKIVTLKKPATSYKPKTVDSCIFCKIITHQIKSTPVLETDLTLVIQDLHPQAPIHYLVIPKTHIEHMGFLQPHDAAIISDMAMVIQQLSSKLVQPAAFNVISNNGAGAGQTVFHMHWHFLSKKNLYTSGFKL